MKKVWKKAVAVASSVPLLFGSAVMMYPAQVKAQNPFVQSIYTSDPAPMVYDGAVYVYTGHDEDGASYYEMNDWRCYKTTDMANWTDLGSPASYKTFSWCTGDAWAAQCIERNGKFYLYVPVNVRGATAIGVGVADKPEGPFKDAIGKPLIAPGYGNIDPTVYIDNDGQAYLYWGNPTLKYVKLNKDMVSYSGGVQTVNMTTQAFGARYGNKDRSTLFEEGPWFYRRGNLYYMIYAASGIPENICYSTSTSPTGPWTFRGEIMATGGGSFTNHPGVVDYKGHSYFFYHNGQLPGGNGFQRSVAVEEFKYNPDGSIPKITMSKNGPAQLSYVNPYVKNEAEMMCYESGIETETCGEGTLNVAFIDNGDYVMVKGVDFGTGAKSFDARVASATNGGNIEIRLDSPTGKLVGTCKVEKTAGWQSYTTKSCTISGATGTHDLYFKFTGGSGSLMNFNWWKFSPINDVQPTVPPTVEPTKVVETTQPVTSAPAVTGTLEDGWYYIKSASAQKYLQVKDNQGANAQNVEIGTFSGLDGQKWKVQNNTDGSICLVSALGDYMLDIGAGSTDDGANVQIYAGYGGTAQRFYVKETSTKGTYTIGTKVTEGEKYVDVADRGTADGTNVLQWRGNGGTNQQWIFEKVSTTPVVSVKPSEAPEPTKTAEPTKVPEPTKETPVTTTPVENTGITYEYKVISDWGGSWQGEIVVTNKSDKVYNGWTLTCNYNSKIDNLWGAELVGQTENKVTIKNPSWSADLGKGQSVTIDFIASGSDKSSPTDFLLR